MSPSNELPIRSVSGGLDERRHWRPGVGVALSSVLAAASIAIALSQVGASSLASRPLAVGSRSQLVSFVDTRVGNYPITATLKFIDFAGPGGDQVTITPAGGGSGKSNCTRDESSESFKLAPGSSYSPAPAQNVRTIKMIAKDEGSCLSEASYETWNIQLHGPFTHGTGHIWLGQNHAGSSYYLSCENGDGKSWSNLQCFVQSSTADAVPYHAVAIVSPRR